MPRVAFFLPSLDGGGAERVMLNLACGFRERGVQTDIVLSSRRGPYLAAVPSSIRVVDLNAARVMTSLRPLVGYLNRERPHAIVAALDHANLVAMAAGRLARTPTRTVVSIHCVLTPQQSGSGLREHAIPWLLGTFHRWADEVVAVSEGVADDTTRVTGIPRQRIRVIYNPVITPELLSLASKKPDHPWFGDGSSPIVLGVGRLTPQKNFLLLIRAFEMLRRRRAARLVILGEGPQRAELEALVRQRGLEADISLPGFVENPYACMANAGVYALSSNFEGLPTALIESLAVGTPVVATDCESGPREILRDGALGALVPVDNAEALATALEQALMQPRKPVPADVLRPYMLDAAVERFIHICGLDAKNH